MTINFDELKIIKYIKKKLLNYSGEKICEIIENLILNNKCDFKNMIKNEISMDFIESINQNDPIDIEINEYDFYCKKIDCILNKNCCTQNSIDWYQKRSELITASNAAIFLGESKYNTIEEGIKEKLEPKIFKKNDNMHHGIKYEKIAKMIYENIYDTKILDVGLILHDKYFFIGASPDGINDKLNNRKRKNKKIGELIEIKCPKKRKILQKGKVDGEICPHDYWIQIQLQLECCDLNKCDFWQCDIKEFTSFSDLKNNETITIISENDESNNNEYTNYNVISDKINYYGCIIQLKPININLEKDQKKKWYSEYIYPEKIFKNIDDSRNWGMQIENNFENLYSSYKDKFVFNKLIYWKLINAHNTKIYRDVEWFSKNIIKLENVWNEILEYKNDEDKKKKFLSNFINNKKSFNKFISTIDMDTY